MVLVLHSGIRIYLALSEEQFMIYRIEDHMEIILVLPVISLFTFSVLFIAFCWFFLGGGYSIGFRLTQAIYSIQHIY